MRSSCSDRPPDIVVEEEEEDDDDAEDDEEEAEEDGAFPETLSVSVKHNLHTSLSDTR